MHATTFDLAYKNKQKEIEIYQSIHSFSNHVMLDRHIKTWFSWIRLDEFAIKLNNELHKMCVKKFWKATNGKREEKRQAKPNRMYFWDNISDLSVNGVLFEFLVSFGDMR